MIIIIIYYYINLKLTGLAYFLCYCKHMFKRIIVLTLPWFNLLQVILLKFIS